MPNYQNMTALQRQNIVEQILGSSLGWQPGEGAGTVLNEAGERVRATRRQRSRANEDSAGDGQNYPFHPNITGRMYLDPNDGVYGTGAAPDPASDSEAGRQGDLSRWFPIHTLQQDENGEYYSADRGAFENYYNAESQRRMDTYVPKEGFGEKLMTLGPLLGFAALTGGAALAGMGPLGGGAAAGAGGLSATTAGELAAWNAGLAGGGYTGIGSGGVGALGAGSVGGFGGFGGGGGGLGGELIGGGGMGNAGFDWTTLIGNGAPGFDPATLSTGVNTAFNAGGGLASGLQTMTPELANQLISLGYSGADIAAAGGNALNLPGMTNGFGSLLNGAGSGAGSWGDLLSRLTTPTGGSGNTSNSGSSPLGGLLSGLAGAAPGVAALSYALNQPGADTSRLSSLYSQYSPDAQAGLYDVQSGLGRGSLTSNLARRGISGSSFGDQSLTNYDTMRGVGRSSLINQGVTTQAGIAGQIGALEQQNQKDRNDLYGRGLLALSGGLTGGGNSGVFNSGGGGINGGLLGGLFGVGKTIWDWL